VSGHPRLNLDGFPRWAHAKAAPGHGDQDLTELMHLPSRAGAQLACDARTLSTRRLRGLKLRVNASRTNEEVADALNHAEERTLIGWPQSLGV